MHRNDFEPECGPERRNVPVIGINRCLTLYASDCNDLTIEFELCAGRFGTRSQIAGSDGIAGHRGKFDSGAKIERLSAEAAGAVQNFEILRAGLAGVDQHLAEGGCRNDDGVARGFKSLNQEIDALLGILHGPAGRRIKRRACVWFEKIQERRGIEHGHQ